LSPASFSGKGIMLASIFIIVFIAANLPEGLLLIIGVSLSPVGRVWFTVTP
jgi:hypothetical protein